MFNFFQRKISTSLGISIVVITTFIWFGGALIYQYFWMQKYEVKVLNLYDDKQENDNIINEK